MPPPYVLAQIELAEQPGLFLLTNVIGCEPETVTIGMPVTVTFEQAGEEAWVPVFTA